MTVEPVVHEAIEAIMRAAPEGSHCANVDGKVYTIIKYKNITNLSEVTVTLAPGTGSGGGNQLTWSILDFVRFYRSITDEQAHSIISKGRDGKAVYKSAPYLILPDDIYFRSSTIDNGRELYYAKKMEELKSDNEVLQDTNNELDDLLAEARQAYKELLVDYHQVLREERQAHKELLADYHEVLQELEAEKENRVARVEHRAGEPMGFSKIGWDLAPKMDYSEQFRIPVPPQAGDEINHPSHYTSDPSGVECNTIRENWCSNLADALKYLWRHGQKPGEDATKDLRKAMKYIEFEIDRINRNK